MRILIAMAALAVCACSQDTPSGPAAEPEAGAAAPAAVAGAVPRDAYVAASTTATSITGDLMVTDAGIHFSQSQDYFTEAPQLMPASSPYAAGATFADALGVPESTQIELRHVSIQNVGEGAPNGGLCGEAAVTYVALAAAPDTTGQTLLRIAAFRGAAPPGPQARANDLCGTFNYMPGAPAEAPPQQ